MEHTLDIPSDGDDRDDEQKAGVDITSDERRRRQLQAASQRSRKRQKQESQQCASQISAIHNEIAELKRQLATVAGSSRDRASEKLELERRIAFMKSKLKDHGDWMVRLRNLLATAPLLDFALREHDLDSGDLNDEDEQVSVQAREYARLDTWRDAVEEAVYSPTLIATHVHAAVALSQDNTSKLLAEFDDPECDFNVRFSSRGWSHAAHVDDTLFTFRSHRVVASALVKTIAEAVWRSLQLDDILRTFVPLVQDVVSVYEAETAQRVVAARVLQLENASPPEAVVTVESMQECGIDGTMGWQIAVETCVDPCLIAYAADRLAAASKQSPNPSSPLLQAAGQNLTRRPDFVVAARCFGQSDGSGVVLQLAGSIRHDNEWLVNRESAGDLVQYLVCMMPVYEELHLLQNV